jgi:tripartite-type tricarboxylate transporter receptor subunit TctC
MYAPHGTPKKIVDTLAGALQVALKDPAVKQRFADLGTEPVAESRATPDALRAHVKSEINRWGPIITKAGAYAD